jgi:ABC-type sugar transport system substrate-binding protein
VIVMRRPVVGGPSGRTWVLGLIGLGLIVGCEPAVGVPGPTRSRLPDERPSEPAKAIGLVVPAAGVQAAGAFDQVFRHVASQARVVPEIVAAPTGREAETIREMAGRGVAAMVVVPRPEAAEAIAPALEEVREAKIPVVLLQHPVPGIEPPLPLVRFAPLEESARALVAEAVKRARAAGFPEDAPAVLVVNGPVDQAAREQVAALHQALEEAHVPTLPDVNFQGYQSEARGALAPVLKEHPEVGIVLGIDDQGVMAAAGVRDAREEGERRYAFGGYIRDPESLRLTQYGLSSGLVLLPPQTLARRAFEAAVKLGAGEAPEEGSLVVETPLNLPQGEEREGYFPRYIPESRQPPAPGNAVE